MCVCVKGWGGVWGVFCLPVLKVLGAEALESGCCFYNNYIAEKKAPNDSIDVEAIANP